MPYLDENTQNHDEEERRCVISPFFAFGSFLLSNSARQVTFLNRQKTKNEKERNLPPHFLFAQ